MKKIAQILLAVVIVAFVYVIYKQISTPIRFENDLKSKSAQVIERIKDIRTAERAYKSKYQKFTVDWDTLANFITCNAKAPEGLALLKKQGKKNVEKFTVAVIDTIFSPKKLSKEEILNMRYIPTTNNQAQFILEAGQITTESKIVIPVLECRAPYIMFLDTVTYRQEIINKIDDDVNNFNRYPGIKFGSMDAGNNEAGNWED